MNISEEQMANSDPFALFSQWFEDAKQTEINDPDAIALASVSQSGRPSVRMVLLKEITSDGFIFYTNYESRKAGELLATGEAAFVVHWKSLRRQIRVVGKIDRLSPQDSDAYFATRPRDSQIGAWASEQSQPLASRDELKERIKIIEDRFPDHVPRPPYWGGFIVRAEEIEFWADGAFRLHDRFRFSKDDQGNWVCLRLYP